MNIIKLNAIDSTNEFLKKLKRESHLADFTVVTADFQSQGKGQMGTIWESESGKNQILSVLKRFKNFTTQHQFAISLATSIAVYKALNEFIPDKLRIKWPNDILSDGLKIAGILIENTINDSLIVDSVIGIGINVNQDIFNDAIQKVTSLKLKLNTLVDRDLLLNNLLINLEKEFLKVANHEFSILKEEYESLLYKKEIPTMFEDNRNCKFLGIIKGVSDLGQLQVYTEDEKLRTFNLKEIKLL